MVNALENEWPYALGVKFDFKEDVLVGVLWQV